MRLGDVVVLLDETGLASCGAVASEDGSAVVGDDVGIGEDEAGPAWNAFVETHTRLVRDARSAK